MKRTPAPVSTASAASIIWSGVGDGKSWPGQAASRLPRLSSSTFSVLLISIFINVPSPIVLLAVRLNPSAHALGVAREPRSEIDNELFERTVLLVVAEVGNSHRDGARVRFAQRRA